MNRNLFPTGVIILIMLGGTFCTKKIFTGLTNYQITTAEDRIFVTGENYQLSISKYDGFISLRNKAGVQYTSFPLHAQLTSAASSSIYPAVLEWQIKGKVITLLINQAGLLYQKIIIKPLATSFEIQFGIKYTLTDSGIWLFKKGQFGFNTEDFETIFSPEPDDYTAVTPQIDVRVDRDQQWAFAPAPLNLSFQTKAGWFSIGCARLPEASVFAYHSDAIYLDYPWSKIKPSMEVLHWLAPLVFTFNESPWEAVGDFQAHLVEHDYVVVNHNKAKNQPAWWSNPIVGTWGEQLIEGIRSDAEMYNSNWVRNYVVNQESVLDSVQFTLIIADKWARADGDPTPSARFKDLRQLIDWCHDRGHKVILWWKCWKVEAKSLAVELGVTDGEYVDATHPKFEEYVDQCCQMMLGAGENQLNADGIRLDHLFLVRDPASANYANPAIGMGMKELYHYMKVFYQSAKKYKPDCLISSNAIDPHFNDVQDMVRINNDWDNKLRREKRARIISQALPGMLIDGDATDMYNNIALYHYTTSAIYGIPSIQYLTHFHDGAISDQTKNIIANIIRLSAHKPMGQVKFVDYGNWRIIDDERILAESLPQGKGIVIYSDENHGTLLCSENSSVHFVLNTHTLKSVTDEKGNKIPFKHLGEGIHELTHARQGEIYKLSLRKKLNIYE